MRRVSINLLTNVILLLAGIILIVFHNVPNILIWGARVMGATFMLPAIAYLVMVAVRHADARTSTEYMGVLPAVGGLCFGLVMIVKAHLFDEILQLLMGVLLLVLGLFHIIYLILSKNSLNIKGWYHICPLIVVLCGVLSLLVPALRENVSTVVLITGICLLLFNFTSLQEYLAERRVRNAAAAVEPSVGPSVGPADEPVTTPAPISDDV
jgi:peptidoglycan/LPS O-acetylase OafA/YrhL